MNFADMNLTDIRRQVIRALFSDEFLYQHLVLKGGNALELVHGLISRGSVDIDVSISGDFEQVDDVRERIYRALQSTFAESGFVVFDEHFEVVPAIVGRDLMPWWGGYLVVFKLISRQKYDELGGVLEDLQRQALPIDSVQGRKFRIDISKHEYCRDKVNAIVAGQPIYVYSEEMCVFEKMRSICQQMPTYTGPIGRSGRARARDFYDIYTAITRRAMDITLSENLLLCESMFQVKHVPIRLLASIAETREFHRPDWDDVRGSVVGEVFDFDFYFDYVLDEVRKLESLWIE